MPDSNSTTSRRTVVHGMTAGIAAAFAAPAVAQGQAPGQQPASGGPAPLTVADDPRSRYAKPPYPQQDQPWPGLARDMQPRPDHGETSYRGSGRLTGRKALITGGDSGIGRAAAIAYAREGADVAISYLEAEQPDADEVLQLIRAEGRRAIAVPGDITDAQFCARMVADAVRQLGGLDILVNNAAFQSTRNTLEEITPEQFDRTFKTNVYAPFWITKAALPHLRAGAAIINTASQQGYDPGASLLDYAQTKACNIAFTKSLAKQLIERGIRVNGVAPGPFWTPLQPADTKPPEEVANHGRDTPIGRAGQPVELAPVYVMLASGEASYITGQIIGASGGSGTP